MTMRLEPRAILAALPLTTPTNIKGLVVERLPHYYRVGNQILTPRDALAAIASHLSKVESTQKQPKVIIPDQPIFPPELRAMSMHFPWAWLAVKGFKEEEFRTVPTKYRGLALIQASGSKDSDWVIDQYKIPAKDVARKAIIGAVKFTDCYPDPGDPSAWAYLMEDPIYFDKPIPVSGQQSIFWPASTPERVRAFNQAWLTLEGKI